MAGGGIEGGCFYLPITFLFVWLGFVGAFFLGFGEVGVDGRCNLTLMREGGREGEKERGREGERERRTRLIDGRLGVWWNSFGS